MLDGFFFSLLVESGPVERNCTGPAEWIQFNLRVFQFTKVRRFALSAERKTNISCSAPLAGYWIAPQSYSLLRLKLRLL